MRSKNLLVSERTMMFVIGGQLFDQAPNRHPRNAEIIMQKVRDLFRKDAHNNNEYYTLRISEKDLYKYIKELLMGISEFVELNLSQVEFDNKVSVDDDSRPKYSFSSRYDKYDSESWKTDFIDLDAFIQNVYNRLLNIIEMDSDCFLCIYDCEDHDSEICNRCSINPNLEYNYTGSRAPKGKYTFSCKYDCKENKQICCEECDKNNNCTYKCDGNSNTCGNKL